MKGPAVAHYAARTVFRNRRATFAALIGIALGVAVVVAPSVALDSSMRGLMDYYVDGLSVDATAYGPTDTLANATAALSAVRNVERTEPLRTLFVNINYTASGLKPETFRFGASLQFVEPSFEALTPRLGISWDAAPSPGHVILPVEMRAQGLEVGENITFETVQPRYDDNGTYLGDEVHQVSSVVAGFHTTSRSIRFQGPEVYVAASDLSAFETGLEVRYALTASVYIWIHKDRLLDPYDPAGSSQRVERQLILMQNAAMAHGYNVNYAPSDRGLSLEQIPLALEGGTFGLRLLFFIFAIPTLAMAALLTRVGFDIGVAARRRELSVLRARGFSIRGVQVVLALEAILVGALGALVGVVASVGLSRLFAVPNPAGWGTLTATEVSIQSGTVIFALLVGWLLALFAARRGIRMAGSQEIVAGLKAYNAEEVAIPYKASRDFLMAAVAAAGFLLLVASTSSRNNFSFLAFILGFSTAILAPAAPLLLTAATVRYLTRGTTKAYVLISRLFKKAVGELQPLVEKNIVRAPRRASNTAVIATFAVAFVLVVSITGASADQFRMDQIRRQVPSDIFVDAYMGPAGPGAPSGGQFGSEMVSAVEAVEGVAAVTPAVYADSIYGQLVVFEASTYLQTAPWVTAAFVGQDPKALMAQLDGGPVFAANKAFEEATGLQPGDQVFLGAVLGINFTARFVSTVRELPGLSAGPPGSPFPAAFLDLSNAAGANFSYAIRSTYMVSVSAEASVPDVAKDLRDLFGGSGSVRTYEEAVAAEANNPFSVATFSYLTTQTQVAVALCVAGVGLMVYTGAALRRNELATLVARGAGSNAVARLVMAEGWVVSILGLLLGVFGGLITAAMILSIVSFISSAPFPFVVPWQVAFPLGAAVAGVWVASFLGAQSIQRMDVARVLKLRGG